MSKKKSQLSSTDLDRLTYEDGCLFHDGKGRPLSLPTAQTPLADTHGHLTHFRQHDPVEALARAALAGVGLLGVPVDPADDARDSHATLDFISRCIDNAASAIDRLCAYGVSTGTNNPLGLLSRVRIWAGVHPYGAAEYNANKEIQASLNELLDSPLCVGVGEFGFDFGPYNRCPVDEQERAFTAHLHIAHERGLPIQLHLRNPSPREDGTTVEPKAHQLAARILEREGVPAAGCDLHCFTSAAAVMAPFVEMGCHIAFGGAATFARSNDIRAAALACPSGQLLSETDSPYMAPVPLRGQECEPAMVAFTVAALAQLRFEAGLGSVEKTYQLLWQNACELFGVSQT